MSDLPRVIEDNLGGGLPYYDRAGNVIDMWEWSRLFRDRAYKRVALTYMRGIRVSMVWLGLDHSWYGSQPIIFETMCFVGHRYRHKHWEWS